MNNKSAHACRWLVSIGLLIALSGCETAVDPARMVFTTQPTDRAFPEHLQRAVCVRSVTGGEKTSLSAPAKVADEEFRTALMSSLDSAGLSATPATCHDLIDANLLGLSQPSWGSTITVTSHVNYKVYDAAGQPVLMETISAPFTPPCCRPGVVLIRMGNEGSIRSSIAQFLEKLRDVKLQ